MQTILNVKTLNSRKQPEIYLLQKMQTILDVKTLNLRKQVILFFYLSYLFSQ